MVKEFEKIIKIAEKTNNFSDNTIFSTKTIKEQKENIDDYLELKHKLNKILDQLCNTDSDNDKAIARLLVDLHIALGHLEWHLDELRELVKNLMKFYSKRLPDDLKSLDD